MKCKDFKNLISEFLDGEMEIFIRDEFLNHLILCKKCQGEFYIYLRENMLLKTFLKDVEPPKNVWNSILNLISREESKI